MRNMKTLLRVLGAVTLSTAATSSIVACGKNETKVPQLDEKYAVLLDWYDATSKASKIEQKLNINNTIGQEKVSIETDDTMITITNLFKNKLLISASGTNKFKAKNDDAAKFLVDLGFKSGSTTADYSDNEVSANTALSAEVISSKPGNVVVNANETDFKVAAGTCQINIIEKSGDDAKVILSYLIKTVANNALDISTIVIGSSKLIEDANSLSLTAAEGFKVAQPVSNFKLKINDAIKQKQFTSLVALLKTNVTTKFLLKIMLALK